MKITVSLLLEDSVLKKECFCESILANTYWLRLKGLLGKNGLKNTESIVITPCKQIHTMWMKFAIDIVFVDKNRVVTKLVENLQPYRQAKSNEAYSVIEMAAGMIAQHGFKVGDRFVW